MVSLLVAHQHVADCYEDGQQEDESDFEVGRYCFIEIFPLAMQLHGPLLVVVVAVAMTMAVVAMSMSVCLPMPVGLPMSMRFGRCRLRSLAAYFARQMLFALLVSHHLLLFNYYPQQSQSTAN
jgi:hypothetical protein